VNQALYDKLVEVAKAQKAITYAEVAPLLGLDMSQVEDRTAMSLALREVSEHEFDNDRPLLSAVVVHTNNGMPGDGFFSMASDFELFNRDLDDMDRFFVEELTRVFEHHKA